MNFAQLLLIAIGLSMDAFAAALCKGLGMRRLNLRHAAIIALFFGVFQAVMPLIGWFLGNQFAQYIKTFDHWIAFVLLAIIGGKMLWEAFDGGNDCATCNDSLNLKELLGLAVATSIDALAIGVSLAFLEAPIASSVVTIGVTTFVLSFIGVAVGNRFGVRYRKPAEIAGGAVLVLIGVKILVEHLMGG